MNLSKHGLNRSTPHALKDEDIVSHRVYGRRDVVGGIAKAMGAGAFLFSAGAAHAQLQQRRQDYKDSDRGGDSDRFKSDLKSPLLGKNDFDQPKIADPKRKDRKDGDHY